MTRLCQQAEAKVQSLQKSLKRVIVKSKPYFELKAQFNQILEVLGSRFGARGSQFGHTDPSLGTRSPGKGRWDPVLGHRDPFWARGRW